MILRPSVLIPMVGGIACGLASWLAGGNLYLTSMAIVGIAGSTAWLLTRSLLNIEDLTQQALDAKAQSARQLENQRLDQLARQLRTDRDHRTQDSLNLLRSLRDEFEELTNRPGLEMRSARFREQISQVLEAAVEQLRESYRLFERSESVVGQPRDQVLADRETLVVQVVATVDRLKLIVAQFRTVAGEAREADLTALQNELDLSLQVAKRTEERMRELEDPSRVHQQFIQE